MTKKTAFWIFLLGTISSAVLFLAATWDTHRQVATLSNVDKLSEQVVAGKRAFEKYNCNDCHTILGFGGYYAPDLTKVVQRIGADGVRYRIKSPELAFANSWQEDAQPARVRRRDREHGRLLHLGRGDQQQRLAPPGQQEAPEPGGAGHGRHGGRHPGRGGLPDERVHELPFAQGNRGDVRTGDGRGRQKALPGADHALRAGPQRGEPEVDDAAADGAFRPGARGSGEFPFHPEIRRA